MKNKKCFYFHGPSLSSVSFWGVGQYVTMFSPQDQRLSELDHQYIIHTPLILQIPGCTGTDNCSKPAAATLPVLPLTYSSGSSSKNLDSVCSLHMKMCRKKLKWSHENHWDRPNKGSIWSVTILSLQLHFNQSSIFHQ